MSQILKNLTYVQSISSALRMSIGGFNALYLLSMDISLSELAILQLVFSITVLISEIPSGYLSDLWNRKNMVLIGTILCSIFYIVMYIGDSFETFVVAEVVYALGLCFISGSFEGWISEEAKRCKVNYYELSHEWVSRGGLYSVIGGMFSIGIAYFLGSFKILYLLIGLGFIIPIYIIIKTTYTKNNTHEIKKINFISFFETLINTFKDKIFIKYSIMLSIFVGSMQIIYHFWQPLFFSSKSQDINNYYSSDGILLMLLHGGIFLSQYIFNNKLQYKENSRIISIQACGAAIILLTIVIGITMYADYNSIYVIIAMLLFAIMHGFLSLIPSRIQDFLSANRDSNDFGVAFSISESLARVTSILVLFIVSLTIEDHFVSYIFIIPCLGLLILGYFLNRFLLVNNKEIFV